jgi:SNF2 family DNA or RNA helicase
MSWASAVRQTAAPPEVPPLFAHQVRDVEFYLQQPAVFNTSDAGTGKSRTIIESIRRLKLNKRVLVVAPKSILVPAWGNDLDKFGPELSYSVATAEQRKKAYDADVQIVITNHDAVVWLVKEGRKYLDSFEFVVFDESTAYKRATTHRSKAALEIRRRVERATCLTGTPTPNGVLDLWHQMMLVDLGERLGSNFFRFRSATCDSVQRFGFAEWAPKEGAEEAVGQLIDDCTIRNRRDDCLDLPEHQVIKLRVPLNPTHAAVYRRMKNVAALQLQDGNISAVNAAVLTNKLLQLAAGSSYDDDGVARYFDGDRLDLVMQLVDERPASVVAFNYTHQRDGLTHRAKQMKIPYAVIDGEVASKDRTAAVEAFQAGRIKVIFAHPASAGHGLTLTRGVATIWVSPTWNLEHFLQFNARIYRAGQVQRTETILIAAEDTLERGVYQRLEDKSLKQTNLLEMLR